ncbi:5'-3' exonuclease [Pseudokineococcus sp. 1T1Z-3]|uniref:5'-3' exonuclease n=1 Tax=Pseudokineococcus sp. 1T1Z-3 TaxID=3132745 RepID=UPI0030958C4F
MTPAALDADPALEALRAAGLLGPEVEPEVEPPTDGLPAEPSPGEALDARDQPVGDDEGTSPTTPLLLAVDGNSLLHRAFHAHAAGQHRDAAGRPVWGLRGVVTLIAGAAARLTPDALVVGFDCPTSSRRRDEHPAYKAHRPEKHPDLRAQLDDAPALLAAAGLPVVVHEGFEADDVLASAAALARREGWRCTAVTSDRDSFALVDGTTSVLRVLNGGMAGSPVLTPRTIPLVTGVRAEQYRCLAALRGDTSDNLPGAPGIGPKTAARLLQTFACVDDVYAALDDGREAEVLAAVGAGALARLRAPTARANVVRNQRLMAMHEDLPLPVLDDLRLPLDLVRLQHALGERDVRLGPSLWALVGGAPPADLGPVLPSWVDDVPLLDAPPLDHLLPDGPPPEDDAPDGASPDGAVGSLPGGPGPAVATAATAPATTAAGDRPAAEPMGRRGLARARREVAEEQLDLFG